MPLLDRMGGQRDMWQVGSGQAGADWFIVPEQANHRRYEATRIFVDGLTHAQAAARVGYTRWGTANLVREYRARRPGPIRPRPGNPDPHPGFAPAKDRARARVIQRRRQGLSPYEISAQLSVEGTPLNRTGVAEILTEEGFGRLLR